MSSPPSPTETQLFGPHSPSSEPETYPVFEPDSRTMGSEEGRGHAVNNDSAIGGGHAVVNHGPTERVKGTDVEPIGTISTTVETTTLTAQGDTVTTTTRMSSSGPAPLTLSCATSTTIKARRVQEPSERSESD